MFLLQYVPDFYLQYTFFSIGMNTLFLLQYTHLIAIAISILFAIGVWAVSC